jgi:pimeloyl-ACP methyl ester carboxylesterase
MLYSETTGSHPWRILFVHGNSQSHKIWESICSEPLLSENYTLTRFDLPGHGNNLRSAEPEKDYSVQGMAGALQEMVKVYNKEPYVIVCHSLGTNIVAEIAADLENCKGIFMLGPDIIGGGVGIEDIFQNNPNIATFFTAEPGKEALDQLMDDQVFPDSAEKRNLLEEMYHAADPVVRTSLFNSIQNKEWIDEVMAVKQLNVPVALVYGDHETLCVPGYLDKTDLQKWRGEIIIVKDAGHCLHLDQPGKTAELVYAFCKDCFK